jgi:peptide/nickel transport system permease protein
MAYNRPVVDILKERVPLTVAFSSAALLLSWIIAIPIGIYSATHQYSGADYLFTFIGFLGLGTPGWLLALILGWLSISVLGHNPLGITSVEYIDTPWSWPKVVDVLGHLWFPVLLTGISTTGNMIRTVRNNLLDELQQQYVITARAKGLAEWKLITKYPVRLAISPVISSVGYVLPQMFGGLGIIAVALQLPTVFPVLTSALRLQDMNLAGSVLLALSALTMIGTLLSDILLALVDPRIRLGGGSR